MFNIYTFTKTYQVKGGSTDVLLTQCCNASLEQSKFSSFSLFSRFKIRFSLYKVFNILLNVNSWYL